jgi:hypothetical protein
MGAGAGLVARILGHIQYGAPQPPAKASGESAPLPALGDPDGEKAAPAPPREAVESIPILRHSPEPSPEDARLQARREKGRERMRLWRERKDRGVRVAQIEVYDDAVDALLAKGDITEGDLDDRERFNTAIEDFLNCTALRD